MPAVTRQGDACTGHGAFPPRPSTAGSATVFANGMPLGRVGDPVACGSSVAAGSPNVFAGG